MPSPRRRDLRQAHRDERRGKQASQPSALRPSRLLAWGGGGVLLLAVMALVLRSGGVDVPDEVPAAVMMQAEQNAGTSIEVYGGVHTVLHSPDPLPTEAAPSEDSRPTLVWFSGTWCHFCELMEGFAHSAAGQFPDRMRFVEKSVDHDGAAARRYGVRGTPTFVLIDERGRELARFSYQPDAARFTQQIEAALAAASTS